MNEEGEEEEGNCILFSVRITSDLIQKVYLRLKLGLQSMVSVGREDRLRFHFFLISERGASRVALACIRQEGIYTGKYP